MRSSEKIISHFIQRLKNHFTVPIDFHYQSPVLEIRTAEEELTLCFFKEKLEEVDKLCVLTAKDAKKCANDTEAYSCSVTSAKNSVHSAVNLLLAIDQLATKDNQIISIIRSKLQLNKKVFARNCLVKKITGTAAKEFLNQYHLMGYAKAAYHIGLFLKDELIAVATFSKGRKMNRLEAHQRSYELIHFCSKDGITITGGLSKLLAFFVVEKQPGDIMTYIDKQFSEGASYLKCGFKKHSETPPYQFLINKKTSERNHYKGETFDKKEFYLTENYGNIKLVYKIGS